MRPASRGDRILAAVLMAVCLLPFVALAVGYIASFVF